MCSLNLNSVTNEAIGFDESIERKLKELAFAADRDNAGPLDALETHRTRMPASLSGVRKRQAGRHRLYYSGTHKNCFYDAHILQKFKKSDNKSDKDDSVDFQNALISALRQPTVRTLNDPKEVEIKDRDAAGELASTDAYKQSDWWKKYGDGPKQLLP